MQQLSNDTIQFWQVVLLLVTSCQGVVEDRDDDEDDVDGGEAGEQEVEGVLHVSAGQHHDGDDVAEDAEHAHDRLVTQKYNWTCVKNIYCSESEFFLTCTLKLSIDR